MSRTRRILTWSMRLGCLAAVMICVFQFVRYRPRCVIGCTRSIWHLSADGSRLVTQAMMKDERWGEVPRPVKVWDASDGQLTRYVCSRAVSSHSFSRDGRHAAGILQGGAVCLADCHDGRERQIEGVTKAIDLKFSPKSRWLVVRTSNPAANTLVNLHDGSIQRRLSGDLKEFSPDEEYALMRETEEGRLAITHLPSANRFVLPPETWEYAFVPDGKHLLVWMNSREKAVPNGEDGERGIWKRGIFLWDLSTARMKYRFDFESHVHRHFCFSHDCRSVASWARQNGTSPIVLVDVETARVRWTYVTDRPDSASFSGDGTLLCLWHGRDRNSLTVLQTQTANVRWQRAIHRADLAKSAGIVACRASAADQLALFDLDTGARKATLPADFQAVSPDLDGSLCPSRPLFTKDERFFWVKGAHGQSRPPHFWERWMEKRWPDLFGIGKQGILVMETSTGRELFRVINRGQYGSTLSDDGRTLVTVDLASDTADGMIIRVWDVPPTKTWLAAMGATVLVGLACRLLLKWWGRGAPSDPVVKRTQG